MKKIFLISLILIYFTNSKAQTSTNVNNMVNSTIDFILVLGNLPPEDFTSLNSILNNPNLTDEQKQNQIISNINYTSVVTGCEIYKQSYIDNQCDLIYSNATLKDELIAKFDEELNGAANAGCGAYNAARGICNTDFVGCMATWGAAGWFTGPAYLGFAMTGTIVCTGSLLSCYGATDANYPECATSAAGGGGGGGGGGGRRIDNILYPTNFTGNN
jgi:hypothetical protein